MAAGLVVVKQFERLVVLRWGRFKETKGPGLRFVIPFVETGRLVDLRERVVRVPTQKYITLDNVVVNIDFVVYFKVMDDEAEKAVLEVEDFQAAVLNLAVATLRAVIGGTTMSVALSEREKIRDALQIRLDEVTARWGVKVRQVEINEIDPPEGVKAAMEREKSAYSIKTAEITESEGQRQAAINRAEGEKQSAILKAEGDRQAQILRAEGERQPAILRAEGFSMALYTIFQVARNVDSKTMSLQYFETLKQLGESPATKFVFPMEFTSLLRPFLNLSAGDSQQDSGGQAR